MSKKEGVEKRVLYIGLDDSNHGVYPELCLAYFSTLPKDFNLQDFPFRRNMSLLDRMQSPYRDYRFLILSPGDSSSRLNNLAIAAPSLILPYLEENEPFEELRIGVDGCLTSLSKDYVHNELSDFVGLISIQGYIKYKQGNGKNKVYRQPRILAFADVQVHHLYSTLTLDALKAHEKRVSF